MELGAVHVTARQEMLRCDHSCDGIVQVDAREPVDHRAGSLPLLLLAEQVVKGLQPVLVAGSLGQQRQRRAAHGSAIAPRARRFERGRERRIRPGEFGRCARRIEAAAYGVREPRAAGAWLGRYG